MNTKKEIKKCKQIVKEVLREDEKARNSDLWLILMVWQKKQQIKIFIPYNKLKQMIPAETITRCRRNIQNDERIFRPTDPEVIRKRGKRQQEFREEFRKWTKITKEAYTEAKNGKKKEEN